MIKIVQKIIFYILDKTKIFYHRFRQNHNNGVILSTCYTILLKAFLIYLFHKNYKLASQMSSHSRKSNKDIRRFECPQMVYSLNPVQLMGLWQDTTNIQVSFKVIELIMDTKLKSKVQQHFPNFFQQQRLKPWLLGQCGCYMSHRQKQGKTYFIAQKSFFCGNVTKRPTTTPLIYAINDGIYITECFTYQGNFQNGRAHGYGKLTDGFFDLDGKWQQGRMVKGRCKTQLYTYEGEFKNNKPNGKGKLNIPQIQMIYQGMFQNGFFEDPNGKYTSNKYTYHGSFKKGKKDGYGILTLKKTSEQEQKVLQGQWKQDFLVKQY